LIVLFFIIGLFPNLFFDKINPSAEALASAAARRPGAAATASAPPAVAVVPVETLHATSLQPATFKPEW